jgi:hypothetical protein
MGRNEEAVQLFRETIQLIETAECKDESEMVNERKSLLYLLGQQYYEQKKQLEAAGYWVRTIEVFEQQINNEEEEMEAVDK